MFKPTLSFHRIKYPVGIPGAGTDLLGFKSRRTDYVRGTRVAVTGASGHIGGNLCRALLEQGAHVRALYLNDTRAIDGLDVQPIQGDVLDIEHLLAAFEGVDLVFHLAAVISIEGDPDGSVMRVNVEGTRRVVEACLACGVKRLVHFSSVHAFEQRPLDAPLDETRPLVDASAFAYDYSKALGQQEVLNGTAQGLDAVIVHPTAIVGRGDFKPSLMGQALLDLQRGKLPALIPGGFDWVDVRDVVDGALQAAARGRSGEAYLLSGHWASMRALTDQAAALTGARAPRLVVPFAVARMGVPFMRLYSRLTGAEMLYTRESLEILQQSNRVIRRKKAEDELGYRPRPLSDTLSDTYAWFRKSGMLAEQAEPA